MVTGVVLSSLYTLLTVNGSLGGGSVHSMVVVSATSVKSAVVSPSTSTSCASPFTRIAAASAAAPYAAPSGSSPRAPFSDRPSESLCVPTVLHE